MHVRSQIRHRVIEGLSDGLLAHYRVFGSRRFALNRTEAAPIVDVRFTGVDIETHVMGDVRLNTAAMQIRVTRTGPSDTLDDDLDADEVAVTAALASVDFADLLEERPELVRIGFAEDGQTGEPLGAIVMQYRVEWRAKRNDPESALE